MQKGLRHFSLKVCEKVQSKQVTTYNEVAECLVEELTNPNTVGVVNKKVPWANHFIDSRIVGLISFLLVV